MVRLISIALFLLCLCGGNLLGQEKAILDEKYPFIEGVYLTFNDFMNNQAIPPSQVTAVYSSRLSRAVQNSRNGQPVGLSWDFFADLIFSERSSISIDSLTLELDGTGFEALIPGHNFFGLKINDRLYLNISPHQRSGNYSDPIFGRVAFTGKLMILYVDFQLDGDSYYYVSDIEGNMVREGGMQETVRNTIIFDVEENKFEFADERTFGNKIQSDKELHHQYIRDKKRKKHMPYYADQYNKRNPMYLPIK